MPGDKIGGVRRKKHGGSFQVVIVSEAAEGNLLKKGFPVSFDHHLGHVDREPSGSNGIYVDIVNPPLARQIFGEGDDAALAGVIPNGLELRRRTANAGYRGNVDNLA